MKHHTTYNFKNWNFDSKILKAGLISGNKKKEHIFIPKLIIKHLTNQLKSIQKITVLLNPES